MLATSTLNRAIEKNYNLYHICCIVKKDKRNLLQFKINNYLFHICKFNQNNFNQNQIF